MNHTNKLILLISVIILSNGLLSLLFDGRNHNYDDAVNKLKSQLVDPNSLLVEGARVCDSHIYIAFDTKNSLGGYSDTTYFIYDTETKSGYIVDNTMDMLLTKTLYLMSNHSVADWQVNGGISPIRKLSCVLIIIGVIGVLISLINTIKTNKDSLERL